MTEKEIFWWHKREWLTFWCSCPNILQYFIVTCFHFSNFGPLETASLRFGSMRLQLWFAFILVTLSHWKQHTKAGCVGAIVVICFHFSNFEPLETALTSLSEDCMLLWFAFILVTLSHWKQLHKIILSMSYRCDLLSF